MNSLFKCEHLGTLCHKKIREIFPFGSLHQPTLMMLDIEGRMGQEVVLLCPSATWWKGTRSQVKWEMCLLPTGACRHSSGHAGKQSIAQVPILVVQNPVSSAAPAVAPAFCSASTESESKLLCMGKDYQLHSKLVPDRD